MTEKERLDIETTRRKLDSFKPFKGIVTDMSITSIHYGCALKHGFSIGQRVDVYNVKDFGDGMVMYFCSGTLPHGPETKQALHELQIIRLEEVDERDDVFQMVIKELDL